MKYRQVNGRHTENLSGRKTDVRKCQWLLQFLRLGLLHDSLRLSQGGGVLRACWRQRAENLAARSRAGQMAGWTSSTVSVGGRFP